MCVSLRNQCSHSSDPSVLNVLANVELEDTAQNGGWFLAKMAMLGGPAAVRGMNTSGKIQKWQEVDGGRCQSWRTHRTNQPTRKSTWNENEETMTGLVFFLKKSWKDSFDAPTQKLMADEQSREEFAFEDLITSSSRGRTSLTRTGKETGSRLGQTASNWVGKKCMQSPTSLLKE